jgi:hypothetical protein
MTNKQVDVVVNKELDKYLNYTNKTVFDITDLDCQFIGQRVSNLCEVAS